MRRCARIATALRYIYDAAAGIPCTYAARASGPAYLRAIELAYARPADPGFYRNHFDCKVTFNASVTGVLFDERCWRAATGAVAPGRLSRVAGQIAREEQRKALPWTHRTEHALQQLLGGTARRRKVALLHLSELLPAPQLRRRRPELRDLLAQRRFEYAQQLLRDTELAIGDIATVLQYQDANAFSRAFRAWADCSPSDWRDHRRPSEELPN